MTFPQIILHYLVTILSKTKAGGPQHFATTFPLHELPTPHNPFSCTLLPDSCHGPLYSPEMGTGSLYCYIAGGGLRRATLMSLAPTIGLVSDIQSQPYSEMDSLLELLTAFFNL